MVKKGNVLVLLIIILVFSITVSGCLNLYPSQRKPDINKAISIQGLSVDPNNCAYILGPIVYVNNQFISSTAAGGLLVSEGLPTNVPARVPAGQELRISVRYLGYGFGNNENSLVFGSGNLAERIDNMRDRFETIETITIPALENGKIYLLDNIGDNITSPEINSLTYFHIRFMEYNNSTEKYDLLFTQQIFVDPPVSPMALTEKPRLNTNTRTGPREMSNRVTSTASTNINTENNNNTNTNVASTTVSTRETNINTSTNITGTVITNTRETRNNEPVREIRRYDQDIKLKYPYHPPNCCHNIRR